MSRWRCKLFMNIVFIWWGFRAWHNRKSFSFRGVGRRLHVSRKSIRLSQMTRGRIIHDNSFSLILSSVPPPLCSFSCLHFLSLSLVFGCLLTGFLVPDSPRYLPAGFLIQSLFPVHVISSRCRAHDVSPTSPELKHEHLDLAIIIWVRPEVKTRSRKN